MCHKDFSVPVKCCVNGDFGGCSHCTGLGTPAAHLRITSLQILKAGEVLSAVKGFYRWAWAQASSKQLSCSCSQELRIILHAEKGRCTESLITSTAIG